MLYVKFDCANLRIFDGYLRAFVIDDTRCNLEAIIMGETL